MMDLTTGFVFFGFPISLALLAYVAVLAHEHSAPVIEIRSTTSETEPMGAEPTDTVDDDGVPTAFLTMLEELKKMSEREAALRKDRRA